MLLRGTKTLEPTMFPSICPSEFLVRGMKKPSIYMPCWGLNLKGDVCNRICWRLGFRGVFWGKKLVLGADFHAWDKTLNISYRTKVTQNQIMTHINSLEKQSM
jgi:hypothetical protein